MKRTEQEQAHEDFSVLTGGCRKQVGNTEARRMFATSKSHLHVSHTCRERAEGHTRLSAALERVGHGPNLLQREAPCDGVTNRCTPALW